MKPKSQVSPLRIGKTKPFHKNLAPGLQPSLKTNLVPDRSTDKLLRMSATTSFNQLINPKKSHKIALETVLKQQNAAKQIKSASPSKILFIKEALHTSTGSLPDSDPIVNITTPTKGKDGFVRSKRNQAMAEQTALDIQLQDLHHSKEKLCHRLNCQLIKLDRINEEKRVINDLLIDQIKFCRDLHKATGGAEANADCTLLQSRDAKSELQKEQAIHKRLELSLLTADQERARLLNKLTQVAEGRLDGQTTSCQQVMALSCEQDSETLLREIQGLLQQIQSVHDIVVARKIKHPDVTAAQLSFQAQERSIAILKAETDQLRHKTHELEHREQEAVASLTREQRQIYFFKDTQTRLLTAKTLFKAIERIASQKYQMAFQQLRLISNEHQKCTTLQKAVGKIFLRIKQNKLKRASQKWFQRTFEPSQIQLQQQKLPGFYERKDAAMIEQNKWSAQELQGDLDEQRHLQILKTLTSVTNNWELRFKQWALNHWHRSQTHCYIQALKSLQKCVRIANQHQLSKSLFHWRDCVHDQATQIRFLSLPVKLASKQLKLQVFQSWREYTLTKVLKKRNLILRAFKNLKVARERSRVMKQLTLLGDQVGKQYQQSLKQACFTQMALQNEQAYLVDCQTKLGVVSPQVLQLLVEVPVLQSQLQSQRKQRALRALVIGPFSRQLSGCFQVWARNAKFKGLKFQKDLQILTAKLYSNKLRRGFDLLRICEADKKRCSQVLKIEQVHIQNFHCTAHNRQLKYLIESEDQKVKSMASKQLKRICERAFSQNLECWLGRWRGASSMKKKRLHATKWFINKLAKNLVVAGFNKYKRGCAYLRQDDFNSRRVTEVRNRLKLRLKARTYLALKEFSELMRERSESLKYMIAFVDRKNKVKGMLQWQQVLREGRERDLLVEEKGIVEQIDSLKETAASMYDNQTEQHQSIKRLASVLGLEARLTLQKWVKRFHLGGMQYGFATWKQRTQNLRHRASYLQSLRRHMVLQILRDAWFRWKQANKNMDQKQVEKAIQNVTTQVTSQEVKIQIQHEKFTVKKDALVEETRPYLEETPYINKMRLNVLKLLIKKKEKNFVIPRLEHIFVKWSQHAAKQTKGGKALATGIAKLMLQRGITQIRETNRADQFQRHQSKLLSRISQLFYKSNFGTCFDKWRNTDYRRAVKRKSEALVELDKVVQSYEEMVINNKQFHCGLLNMRNKKLSMQAIMEKLQQNMYERRVKKRQAEIIRERLGQISQRRFLHKLRYAARDASMTQALMEKSKVILGKIYVRACFIQIKKVNRIEKRMARSTYNFTNALMNFQLQQGFLAIKGASQTKATGASQDKQQATRQLLQIFDRIKTQRFRDGQSTLTQHVFNGRKLQTILKSWLVTGRVLDKRKFFQRWRQITHKMDVVNVNENEDGPVNLQCWHLRVKCNALADMMQDDGAPSQLITQVLVQTKAKYFQLADKTVTRFMIHTDDNLKLLPICLDKLRNHARVMRKWRQKLQVIEQMVHKRALYRPFARWRDLHERERQGLSGTPFSELIGRESVNKQKLQRCADSVEMHVEAIENFRKQVTQVLKPRHAGGKKLALALLKNNVELSQHRTLSQLTQAGNLNLQTQIATQLQRNLDIIQQLKDRIFAQEDANKIVAHENDSYRDGALTAVKDSQQVSRIQNEIEILTKEQSDRASEVKHLLEVNQQMAQEIQTRRLEAKISLEQTQQLHYAKILELEKLRQQERDHAQMSSRHSLRYSSPIKVIEELPQQQRSPSPEFNPQQTFNLRQKPFKAGKSPLRYRPCLNE